MVNEATPRLSLAEREAIRNSLEGRGRSAVVPISRILHDVRRNAPNLSESEEDLRYQIVMDATNHGLAIHFDQEPKA